MNPERSQRVLVTGAFGYVGARLARHLAAGGWNLTLGSRAMRPAPVDLRGARVAHMSFSDAASLRAACEQAEFVVHLAGANAPASAADPALAYEVNAVGTARLVAAATAAGVRRFLYVSTAHAYGSPLRGRIDEDTCARATHPYAASHRAGEDVVLHARGRRELEGLTIRLSNSFGAPVHADCDCWMLLVNDLCQQAVTHRRLKLNSSGLQRRDFITLSDTCAAIEHLLCLPAVGEGLYNVGGAWAPTVREMAARVAALCPATLGYEPAMEFASPVAGETSDDLDFRIDRLLGTGFKPTSPVDAEIRATLEFCASRARGAA